MEDVKDPKDNLPRKSRWLVICVPMMILMIFSIVLIPLGLVYLRPTLVTQTHNKMAIVETPTSEPLRFENSKTLGDLTGTVFDIRTWLDYTDFNTTFTRDSVAGLPLMGLFSEWNDSVRATPYVPALNDRWIYKSQPVRAVSLNGWLTPDPSINRWLDGKTEDAWSRQSLVAVKNRLEMHYSTFITEDDFAQIAAAGLDHVKIPIGHWLAAAFPQDSHLPQVGWRYLLRGIEWARRYGLRVYVDIVSDRSPDEALGTLARLSKFFSQSRYENIVTILGFDQVKQASSLAAQNVIREAGFNGLVVGRGDATISTRRLLVPKTGTYQDKLRQLCTSTVQLSTSPVLMEWDLNDGTRTPLSNQLYRIFLKDWSKAQVAVYESSALGWVFTNWKTDLNPRQSYSSALGGGIVPNFNTSSIDFKCDYSTDYAIMGLT